MEQRDVNASDFFPLKTWRPQPRNSIADFMNKAVVYLIPILQADLDLLQESIR